MAKYIPLDALVAEINKRLHQLTDAAFDSMIGRNLIEIRDSLDTLEVKEVNFDFEQDLYKAFGQVKDFTIGMRIARHFFELGMAVSNKQIEEKDMKTGVEWIAEERQRQIEVEGWTKEHDAEHTNDSLAFAAVCYAIPSESRHYSYCPLRKERVPDFWPWDKKWWKPCPENRIRELVKAGALIAAEIDRLQAQKGE